MTQKNKNPSESWLTFVRTSHARSQIRSALRKTSQSFIKKDPLKTELRIVIGKDRPGILKDVTQIISRSHINIIALNANLPTIRVSCDPISQDKADKVTVKLKKLLGIREASYRFL